MDEKYIAEAKFDVSEEALAKWDEDKRGTWIQIYMIKTLSILGLCGGA